VRRETLRRPFPLGAFETRPRSSRQARFASQLHAGRFPERSAFTDVGQRAPRRAFALIPCARPRGTIRTSTPGRPAPRRQPVLARAWSERCPTWLPNRCGAKKWTAAEVALPLDTDWPSYGSPRRKWAFLRLTKQKSTEATAYLLMTFVACAPTCPA